MDFSNVVSDMKQMVHQKGELSLSVRKMRLEAFKKQIIEKEEAINAALKADLGKSSFESYATEVGFILEEIGFILKNLDSWSKTKKVKTPITLFPGKSYVLPSAYGVVLIISPWNYPFQLCLSPFIGAIAAGNRVIIKPSEFAPHTSAIIKELVQSVFESNEVQVIEGGLEETQALLREKFDYIFFTGSTNVGKVIMKAAAENLTPVTLELGGKSPCLIDDTVNLDIAAKRIAWGKFLNAGQTCVAPDYVLVPRNLQEQFIKRMEFYVTSFYGNDARSSEDYARIVNKRHFDRLKDLLVAEKIAFGGSLDRESNFIGPTLMRDVNFTDKVMQDEIFGPILPIIPYDNINEAVEKILSLPKPLAFYVFSESSETQNTIMARVPFGGGCVNDTVIHLANPNLPFGGVGTSGIGSYHGQKSFDTFTHYKSVYSQGTKVDVPLRYPPYKGKLGWLKMFIR